METPREPLSQHARGLAERLKRDGRERDESGKRTAADHIHEIAQAIDRARAQLEQSEPTLASYASQAAVRVGNLATRLRESSLDELMEDARQLARNNPSLYLTGAAAAGFVLARFLKSSAERASRERESIPGERAESAGRTGQGSASTYAAGTQQPVMDTQDLGTSGGAPRRGV